MQKEIQKSMSCREVVTRHLPIFVSDGRINERKEIRRSRIKSGMTPLFNNNAFTLIELLVVVLIIGILAAVALPQYQKAVIKSRYAALKSLTHSIANAQEIYHLANGTYAKKFDELSIDLPAGGTPYAYGNDAYSYPWGFCAISISSGQYAQSVVFCENSKVNMRLQIYLTYSPALPGKRLCGAMNADYNNSIQNKICKAETGKSNYYQRVTNEYTTYLY